MRRGPGKMLGAAGLGRPTFPENPPLRLGRRVIVGPPRGIRRGSRVRIALNGVRAVFHRPHPQKETDRGAVAAMPGSW